MGGVTVESLRGEFRRQVRARAVDVARDLVLERGWDAVRMADVAAQAGVSRPTLYDEFGNKQGLAEALAVSEAERFLQGIEGVLAESPPDATAAITAAARYTFEQADRNPLLRAVLTASRAGEDSLLPLLTTRATPVLRLASETLTRWFAATFPASDPEDVLDVVDSVVRLTVSHLVLPEESREVAAARLGRLTGRYLGAVSSGRDQAQPST